MDKNTRKATWAKWEAAITAEAAKRVAKKVTSHDMYARELSELQLQKDLQRVRRARVIGCTTTGAAIHHAVLGEARCGVVLVEEAAEVLEAHVLAALDESTKHLIMIGEEEDQVYGLETVVDFCCCLASLDNVARECSMFNVATFSDTEVCSLLFIPGALVKHSAFM